MPQESNFIDPRGQLMERTWSLKQAVSTLGGTYGSYLSPNSIHYEACRQLIK